MKRKSLPEYRFETYRRPAKGRLVIYVRFLSASGAVLATRSTGMQDEGAASAEILRLSRELDLPELDARRQDRAEKSLATEDRLAGLSIAQYLAWYWGLDGYHVADMAAAKKKLSGSYLVNNRSYLRLYVDPWEPFAATPLRKASFAIMDRFFRSLRTTAQVSDPGKVLSRATIDNIKVIVRSALNWAAARGLCGKIDFSGIILPASTSRDRGILTDAEVARILALPTQELWREKRGEERLRLDVPPRPRLPGGKHHEEPLEAVDIRMKAFVLIGPFLGFRRGEERGLKWSAVDLARGQVRVESNYTDLDGDKAPKRGSYGTIPLAPELEVVLWELKEYAAALGLDSPGDYVLFNPRNPSKPAPTSTLRRGWERIMRDIGISDPERARRNLVPHGTRHRFATKLLEAGLSPQEAQKMTRHKTLEMLERYSDHVSAETMERAREAIRGRGKAG